MSNRITRKNVEGTFRVFCKMIGKEVGQQPGQWYLDTYLGYCVEEVLPSGGVRQPFGSTRRNTSEMFYTLHFALNLLDWKSLEDTN